MKSKSVMLIAGEPSGDTIGAQLVQALRGELTGAEVEYTADLQPLRTGLEPRFFGAGGPRMAIAGVQLAFDLTKHSITGFPTPKDYLIGRHNFNHLLQLAIQQQPDIIVGIDYNYFNLRFAEAIRSYASHRRSGWFQDWRPQIVKYISPQLWASREGRASQIARDYDLVLSIFPFEKAWYAKRVPKLRVEFVGHPMFDRLARSGAKPDDCTILLLPGSREGELKLHLPVILRALKLIREKVSSVKAKMVAPDDALAQLARSLGVDCEIQIGNLPQALAQAQIAIASTGTVTMECAFFGLPTVTLYKKHLLGVALKIGLIKSKWFSMPNILANEEVFPEFIQSAATPENISKAALELIHNESRRKAIQTKLAEIVSTLGGPGASVRAAKAIVQLLD